MTKEFEDFEKKGGVVQSLPDRRKPFTRRKHKPAQNLSRRNLTGFENEPAHKWELLFSKMNLQGQDPGKMAGGVTGGNTDPHIVWAALGAAKIPKHAEALLIYMATGDRESRAKVWTYILLMLIKQAEHEHWDCRKPGVIDAMALTVIFDVCDPGHYAQLSQRQWAAELDLADHKHWRHTWSPRYKQLRNVVAGWLNRAIDQLERQFPGGENENIKT